MSIPAIVHQTWESRVVPPGIEAYCASWKRHNPDVEHRFFDGDARLAFVRTEFPEYADVYENMQFAIQRADFFRYLAVYRYGGLYADVDMECLRPFARFFQLSGLILSIEAHVTGARQRELGYRHPWQIANCIFAGPAEHPVLLSIIERVAAIARTRPVRSLAEVEDTSGPRLLTRLVHREHPSDVHVLQQIYWLPPRAYAAIHPLRRNMYARHHFMGSWKDQTLGRRPWRRRWIERDRAPNPFPASMFHSRTS